MIGHHQSIRRFALETTHDVTTFGAEVLQRPSGSLEGGDGHGPVKEGQLFGKGRSPVTTTGVVLLCISSVGCFPCLACGRFIEFNLIATRSNY